MRVSVIIPFYNLERYVRPCLASVKAAIAASDEGLEVEVLCVDDGSTDGTAAALDASSFHVIHKENGGEGSARNAGLAVATGDWITFLDGDDVWLESMLSEFVAVHGRHPEADIIGFRFASFEDGAAVPELQIAAAESEYDVRHEVPSAAIFDLGVFPTFFRREKFAGLAFSDLPLGADRLYVAEALAQADRIVMSRSVVHGYRVRAGSMARAVWNERKIRSMIDFAAGSLRALSAGGKRIGSDGRRYLADVLLQVTPKQLRRLTGDVSSVRRYWLSALKDLDGAELTLWQRVKRFGYLLGCR